MRRCYFSKTTISRSWKNRTLCARLTSQIFTELKQTTKGKMLSDHRINSEVTIYRWENSARVSVPPQKPNSAAPLLRSPQERHRGGGWQQEAAGTRVKLHGRRVCI